MTVLSALLLLSTGAPCGAAESPAEQAARLVGAERYEEAAAKFQEALKAEPKNASLHLGLGLCHQSLKRYREAVRSLETAAQLSPDSEEAWYSLGLLYEAVAADRKEAGYAQRRKQLDKAREAWRKVAALGKDPKRGQTAREHLSRLAEELE